MARAAAQAPPADSEPQAEPQPTAAERLRQAEALRAEMEAERERLQGEKRSAVGVAAHARRFGTPAEYEQHTGAVAGLVAQLDTLGAALEALAAEIVELQAAAHAEAVAAAEQAAEEANATHRQAYEDASAFLDRVAAEAAGVQQTIRQTERQAGEAQKHTARLRGARSITEPEQARPGLPFLRISATTTALRALEEYRSKTGGSFSS